MVPVLECVAVIDIIVVCDSLLYKVTNVLKSQYGPCSLFSRACPLFCFRYLTMFSFLRAFRISQIGEATSRYEDEFLFAWDSLLTTGLLEVVDVACCKLIVKTRNLLSTGLLQVV